MNVYIPDSIGGYEMCHPVNEGYIVEIVSLINGETRKNGWQPIKVTIVDEGDNGEYLNKSDSPWLLSSSLIFRQSAIDKMGGFLEKYGELLPLDCDDGNMFIFNPTEIVDALDEGASSILRFKSGKVMRIVDYVFRPEVVKDKHIFKIPNIRASSTFVSDHFVDLWISAGLKGLKFFKIWSS